MKYFLTHYTIQAITKENEMVTYTFDTEDTALYYIRKDRSNWKWFILEKVLRADIDSEEELK